MEYEFFKFVDRQPLENKLNYKAVCRLRMMDATGNYRYIDNSTRLMRLSPAGNIWLILCCYDFSANQNEGKDISPALVNMGSGEVRDLYLVNQRDTILSGREKEILRLIKDGLSSKLIADKLNISIHTVNRHRQNIIMKLSVGNSIEAVTAALAMRLI